MRKLENVLDPRRVTYELSNGQHIQFDARAVAEYGLEHLMRSAGCGHLLPTGRERLDVTQRGKKIGTVPATFEPLNIKSSNWLYDVRPGDFKREGDVWVACRTLGPGDIEAVPGFVWDRDKPRGLSASEQSTNCEAVIPEAVNPNDALPDVVRGKR